MHHDRKIPAGEVPRIRPALQLHRLGLGGLLAMGRGGIGIAAIGADQPVDHRLQARRRVIPVHRRDDHDAMRRHPQRIDLVHPVAGLAQRIVRITAAGPMAQRHRGRDAGLAGMDGVAKFRCERDEVENVDGKSHAREHRLGELDQPPALRHFAGAGVLAARRSVDDQDAGVSLRIVVAALRGEDGVPRGEPVDREVVVRDRQIRARPCG